MNRVTLSCSDMERVGLVRPNDHCDSCHEDQDYGYAMCENESPDRSVLLVTCCRASASMPDHQAGWDLFRVQAEAMRSSLDTGPLHPHT